MKRILFIPHIADLSGAQQVLLDVIQAVDRDRFTPAVLCPAEGRFSDELSRRGVEWEVVENPIVSLAGQSNLLAKFAVLQARVSYVKRLRQRMLELKPDLVFVNTIINFYAGVAARAAGVKSAFYVHEIFPRTPANRFKYGIVERSANLILGPSTANAAMFSADTRKTKFQLMPYGVDLERFHVSAEQRIAARRSLNVQDDTFLVGTVCFVTPRKGVDDYLKAAKLVCDKVPNARFLVVGSADPHTLDYSRSLRAYVQDQGLQQNVEFIEHSDSVENLFAALDVFALASLSESTPRVIQEAMAASLPVVVTAVGGVAEMFQHRESGILVPPRNPEEMAARILELARNDALRARIGERALQEVRRRNSFPDFEKRINQTLTSLTD